MWVESPKGPSVRLLWDQGATETVLNFLRDTRAGCIVTLRTPVEEGENSEEEKSGPSPP